MKVEYLTTNPYFIIGSSSLLLLYIGVMRLSTGSMSVTVSQFNYYLPWIVALSGGFGLQAALYKLTKIMQKGIADAGKIAKTTGVTSSVTMIACCVHHAADVIPILGLSAAAAFLGVYTKELFAVGILFNIFGIVYMLKNLRGLKNA